MNWIGCCYTNIWKSVPYKHSDHIMNYTCHGWVNALATFTLIVHTWIQVTWRMYIQVNITPYTVIWNGKYLWYGLDETLWYIFRIYCILLKCTIFRGNFLLFTSISPSQNATFLSWWFLPFRRGIVMGVSAKMSRKKSPPLASKENLPNQMKIVRLLPRHINNEHWVNTTLNYICMI